MRVAVLGCPAYGAKLYRTDPHAFYQGEKTLEAVREALESLGHEVEVVRAGPGMLQTLGELGPDVVFNIATGYSTKREQGHIAAMLEFLGVPFTGSGSLGHMLGLEKHLAKMVWLSRDVPTPRFDIVYTPEDVIKKDLRYPVIVKPSGEGSSVGITADSVRKSPEEALELARDLLEVFEPPILVEEYVEGREFTVALLGYPEVRALPVEEIVFQEDRMFTYSVKTRDQVVPVCPADLPEDLANRIQTVAIQAFKALKCRDIGRVDIRLSRDGSPYVLEVNTLPGLQPGYSEVPRIAEKAGMDYRELVAEILDCAIKRRGERRC
ncbi:MAG: ATP-grasp domain-containing protein [Firmicutes bacterium]|nr:ATP-grasp domain-containing protein [Candidatus Fermentithermobacillaceae bacterium]